MSHSDPVLPETPAPQPPETNSAALVAPEPASAFEKYVIDSFKHANKFERFVIESFRHANAFEKYVVDSFKRTDESFKKLDHNINDLIESQQFMISQMVTHDELAETEARIDAKMDSKIDKLKVELKEELKEELGVDIKNHTSAVVGKYIDEVRALIKKCDGRTDDTVVTLERKKIITPRESRDLLQTSPFAV